MNAKDYTQGFKVTRTARRIENPVNSALALKIISKLMNINRPMQVMVDIYSADEVDVRILSYPVRLDDFKE